MTSAGTPTRQAQAALAQFAGSGDPATQKAAITKLENIMTTQVPVVPLLNGGAWAEVSSRNYTGLADVQQPVHEPGSQHAVHRRHHPAPHAEVLTAQDATQGT